MLPKVAMAAGPGAEGAAPPGGLPVSSGPAGRGGHGRRDGVDPVSTAGKVPGTVEPLRSRGADAVQALPSSWGSGTDPPDPDFRGRGWQGPGGSQAGPPSRASVSPFKEEGATVLSAQRCCGAGDLNSCRSTVGILGASRGGSHVWPGPEPRMPWWPRPATLLGVTGRPRCRGQVCRTLPAGSPRGPRNACRAHTRRGARPRHSLPQRQAPLGPRGPRALPLGCRFQAGDYDPGKPSMTPPASGLEGKTCSGKGSDGPRPSWGRGCHMGARRPAA